MGNTEVIRKYNVKAFINEYSSLKTKELKQEFLNSIFVKKHSSILEKKLVLQMMIDKSTVTDEYGAAYIDMFLAYINKFVAVLTMYTCLNLIHEKDDKDSSFTDYDALVQAGLLDELYARIDAKEWEDIDKVFNCIIDTFNNHHGAEYALKQAMEVAMRVLDSIGDIDVEELTKVEIKKEE